MSNARNPVDVIDQVLEVLPSTETGLRALLLEIKDRAGYVPPEDMRSIWVAIANTLNGALPWPPKEKWHKQVHAIVKGYAPREISPGGITGA